MKHKTSDTFTYDKLEKVISEFDSPTPLSILMSCLLLHPVFIQDIGVHWEYISLIHLLIQIQKERNLAITYYLCL